MKLLENTYYKEDIEYVANLDLPWKQLENKSILISGASGLIGTFFIDVLMYKNINENLNCKIYALGRNMEKSKDRFYNYIDNNLFEIIEFDINNVFIRDDFGKINYVLHLASNTHPIAYSTDPIGTITTNVIGTYNLLEFSKIHNTERFIFASTCEIYGDNRGDVEFFDEKYCGYIDCNTMRAGYPESKRCGEALCQAFKKQENIDIVIPRFSRIYGPTILMSDSRAISQFIKNAINEENVVLKSEGTQNYSYTYVSDAVSAIFTIMLKGENGEAYNISDKNSDITLKDLANIAAEISNKKVIFDIPNDTEKAGYSKSTKSLLNSEKLKKLGWTPKYDIKSGMERTVNILKIIKD